MLKDVARQIVHAILTCFLKSQDQDLERPSRQEHRDNERARRSWDRQQARRSDRARRSGSVDFANRYGI